MPNDHNFDEVHLFEKERLECCITHFPQVENTFFLNFFNTAIYIYKANTLPYIVPWGHGVYLT
jgi:hypothetical protein